MKIIGKCSCFGGANDCGMSSDTGLALYEPHEADRRPDIFLPAPADDPKQETWKRLRTDFPYVAMRFSKVVGREWLQNQPWKITNPKTGQWVMGFVVDYGPAESTGRVVDLSPGIMARLRIKTDDEVIVETFV